MEQRIVNTANLYRQKAIRLLEFEADGSMDEHLPAYVQSAFIKLYFAKELETELEKCEEFLSEETEEEVFGAVSDAAEAIDSLAEEAFSVIDEYGKETIEFAKLIEELSASSDADNLIDNFYKLYKCEGIIRMAYRCAKKFPIYGIARSWEQQGNSESDVALTPEDAIMSQMGIDINELLKIRQDIVESIKVKGEAKSL